PYARVVLMGRLPAGVAPIRGRVGRPCEDGVRTRRITKRPQPDTIRMQQPEKQSQPPASERDHASMGAFGGTVTSSRAGYIPISLEQLPVESLAEIPVFVRLGEDHPLAKGTQDQGGNGFRLYASPSVRFAELHRRRLREHGVKFVYIRMGDHT